MIINMALNVFDRYRKWKVKRDLEECLYIFISLESELVELILEDKLNVLDEVVDGILEGVSAFDQAFEMVAYYLTKIFLAAAEYQQDNEDWIKQSIIDNDFEDVPNIITIIFGFLYMGTLFNEKGDLSDTSFECGRDSIYEHFVDLGLNDRTVQDYFIEGSLLRRKQMRAALGKDDDW